MGTSRLEARYEVDGQPIYPRRPFTRGKFRMVKALIWIVVIIFVIGLLVVFGVMDLIF